MNSTTTSVVFIVIVVIALVLIGQLQKRGSAASSQQTWLALTSGLEALIKNLEDGVPPGVVHTKLQKGEVAIDSVPCQLLEYRSGGSTYQGGSRGVSVRIMKGVSYRVGANRGQLVRNPEELMVIDTGEATFTNQRVVFGGQSQTRTWDFDNLVDYNAGENGSQVMISVSNRQKVSGLHSLGAERVQPGILLEVATAYSNEGKAAALKVAQAYLKQYRALEPAKA